MEFFCYVMKSLQVGVEFVYSCLVSFYLYSKESEIDQTLNLTLYMKD